MKALTNLSASRTARPCRLRLDLPHNSADIENANRSKSGTVGCALGSRRLIALGATLLLLRFGAEQLLAQQPQYPPQYGAYNGQYPATPQAAYRQPGYAQPQPLQPYYGQPQYPPVAQSLPQQGSPPQAGYAPVQPLSAAQLEQLAAPIALYPDTLVAQVLAASTYPGQVVQADRWRQAQGNASPDQIAAGADVQPWDASVKALTAFPQVLAQMDQNLQWTTDLGNAYYNQPQDLLGAIQILRQRAQAAGNLQTRPQETVSYDQSSIELAPPNPQVVYVPTYNPWTVYGQPVSPYPGFSLLSAVGSFVGSALSSGFGSGFGGGSPIGFGTGILMSAFNSTPWGWLGWALNWLNLSVLFIHNNYYSHSTTVADWGFPHR